jgi:hypothetical protein
MPNWVPSFDNGAVGFLFGTGALFIGWYLRTMLPAWKDQSVAKAKKIEAEAQLVDTARETQIKLVKLSERQTEMQSSNTNAIGILAEKAGNGDTMLRDIYRHLLSGCKCAADRAVNASTGGQS